MMHVLLTGGSSDLALAIASALTEQNSHLRFTVTGRSESSLARIQKTLSSSAHVEVLILDLLIKTDRDVLIKWIQINAPDLVINNAGIGLYGEALSHTIEEQLNILELNARVTIEISLHAARALRSNQKKGTILNISSASDYFPYPNFSIYAASKACVSSFSQSFDHEMAPYGVRILTSSPGPIATQFRKHASKGYCQTPAHGALLCKQAATHILWQINTGTPYHVFPLKIRIGRALMKALLPISCHYLLLTKFLKNYHPKNSR